MSRQVTLGAIKMDVVGRISRHAPLRLLYRLYIIDFHLLSQLSCFTLHYLEWPQKMELCSYSRLFQMLSDKRNKSFIWKSSSANMMGAVVILEQFLIMTQNLLLSYSQK